MISFILRRLAQSVLVMAVVSGISFSLFNFVGDPVNNMVGQEATREQRQQIRVQLGLEDPIITQYVRFMGNALSGDFGLSYRIRRPVSELIFERLPATIELVFVSAIIALVLGLSLGVYTGIKRDTWLSRATLSISLVGVSLPTFVIGIALIYLFAVLLRWLPSSGRGGVVDLGFWQTSLLTADGWRSIILPAITLSLFQLTLILRLVRAEMLEVMRTDYIKFARARGLAERSINFVHALRNTLVPVITIIGLNIGGLIAFSVITETVFQWPGTGLMFIQAVDFVDVPIMAAYLVFVALLFVTINLIVDILYFVIDPRIRLGIMSATDEPGIAPPMTRWARLKDNDIFWSFITTPSAMVAALIAITAIIACFAAPLIAPHNPFDPAEISLWDGKLPPVWVEGGNPDYLLGTDNQGRDMLSTLLYGGRLSILVGMAAVAFGMVLGVALGLIAGYVGGGVDSVIMRAADVQLTIPGILLAILINGIGRAMLPLELRQEFAIYVVIFAIGLTDWPQFARVARGATLVETSREYVQAARIIGLPGWRIMTRHILPNTLRPVLVIATIGLALAIIAEATLSFLGQGIPPTTPSLGTLIRVGNEYLFSGLWWITFFPAIALVILVFAVNLLGDWMRDALNPKLR